MLFYPLFTNKYAFKATKYVFDLRNEFRAFSVNMH